MSSNSESIGTLVFTDLDNCLLQSIHRIDSLNHSVASVARDGSPQGGMSFKQAELWKWLQAADAVIPVTGRSPEQLNRVQLTFTGPSICFQGAVILHSSGKLDEAWWNQTQTQSLKCVDGLERLVETLAPVCDKWRVRPEIVCFKETPLFLKIRPASKEISTEWVNVEADLRTTCDAVKKTVMWSIRADTRELLILPPHIGKERAVGHLIETLNPSLSIGIGHSDADRPFMVQCDAFIQVGATIAPGQRS